MTTLPLAHLQQRRTRLLQEMLRLGGGVAIIPTAPEVMRNRDSEYPYRFDSHFYYLSGFTEPESVLLLIALPHQNQRSILFCRDKNPEREIWDGPRCGPENAAALYQVDNAYSITQLENQLSILLVNTPTLFYHPGKNSVLDQIIQTQIKQVNSLAPLYNVYSLIDEMRLFKDENELNTMRHAARISARAHQRAMQHARVGLCEYQLEAEILHEFRYQGADAPAYGTIVATGKNACILHYRAGSAVLQENDLVLIDAGCEVNGYASDISRTFPVSGTFSAPQQALYEIVLAAQLAAIDAVRPGNTFMDAHTVALSTLAQGILDVGLLDKTEWGNVDDVIAQEAYKPFYMHRTGHWLGLDVHDVGSYRVNDGKDTPLEQKPSRILEPGMVTTVEPGIYVRPAPNVPEKFWHIGIRIEDDVAITQTGHNVLSQDTPKAIHEILALMRQR
jgi:Xaa-Pro aminopeptidase